MVVFDPSRQYCVKMSQRVLCHWKDQINISCVWGFLKNSKDPHCYFNTFNDSLCVCVCVQADSVVLTGGEWRLCVQWGGSVYSVSTSFIYHGQWTAHICPTIWKKNNQYFCHKLITVASELKPMTFFSHNSWLKLSAPHDRVCVFGWLVTWWHSHVVRSSCSRLLKNTQGPPQSCLNGTAVQSPVL